MSVLDIAALLILIILALLIGAMFWYLGALPGRIAKERDHPYEQAIMVGGWTTLILGAVAWPFVLMWAYTPIRFSGDKERSDENKVDLHNEIKSLQVQVEKLTQEFKAQRGANQ